MHMACTHMHVHMGAWVYGVGHTRYYSMGSISNTQVQANRLHAQKMLSILSSIANMVGGGPISLLHEQEIFTLIMNKSLI